MNQEIKTFQEWYNSLSTENKEVFRYQFLSATGLKYPTFYSKLARGRFAKLEQDFIIKYAGCQLDFNRKKKQ